MRSVILAALVIASASAGYADETSSIALSTSELRNVWRTCDVSGRARAAKVHCINEQAEKLVRGKVIQQTSAESEEATRRQVGARRP